MKLGIPGRPHLTYCTNIHHGESWAEVRANLERYVPAVKARVVPNDRFGVGLRLSARAADELASGDELMRFKEWLHAQHLYVYTINGFPYGAFHGERVKEQVYRPDWTETARLHYTDRLAELLAELLPAECPDLAGTISTVPLGFQPRVTSDDDLAKCGDFLLAHVARLIALRERTGKTLGLALEPEPCCALEGVDDTVRFFERSLFSAAAVKQVARSTGLSRIESEEAIRRHLGVCFDACHFALQFIEPDHAIRSFAAAALPILKVQLSAGLRATRDQAGDAGLEGLRQFADSVYLHQSVVKAADGTCVRYGDLPDMIRSVAEDRIEWRECRVHCHVPIFREQLGPFSNTQPFLRALLDVLSTQAVTQHLEVETYTWDVLPEAYRTGHVVESVVRELDWVLGCVGKEAPALGCRGAEGKDDVRPAFARVSSGHD